MSNNNLEKVIVGKNSSTLIKVHDFNSSWYGKKVGIITDVEFFSLPQKEQDDLLSLYEWVEYRTLLGAKLPLHQIHRSGFFRAETNLRFRLNLKSLNPTDSTDSLTIRTFEEENFRIDPTEIATFKQSHLYYLPGITTEMITELFSLFGNRIIDNQPDRCMQILLNGEVQGWFLSEKTESGLNLTLGMAHKEAEIFGFVLFKKAFLTYAEWNEKIGYAAFSASNGAAHNIYSTLGARFVEPEGIWLRTH